ncbi:hypothetical protein V5799_013104 [Amblyomma americanum]|uniref:Lipocal-1 1 n=1 Tax=Amblyomma americanum TaxID=6943 RepID=A0AAQ4E6T7_AMBAM
MYFVTLFFAALIFPPTLHASKKFLDNNPALGAYQDTSECFPSKANFYLLYRNYEYDPNYGGMAKCVYATQHDPVVRDSTVMTFNYGGNKRPAKITFGCGPGYTEKNVASIKHLDGSNASFNLTAVYLDCSQCHILRSDYIDGGAGCMLWVPGDALNEDHTCCDFIFDLLCGTSPKYQIYEGCK